MIEITENKLSILSWCNNPEDSAIKQANNLANLPFAFKQICLMPDTHCGYGMPIGGVLATKNVVIPNAVGVDIGCGMCAVKSNIKEISIDNIKEIMSIIRESVPVGFNHHKEKQENKVNIEITDDMKIVKEEYKNSLYSLGTLGGGNHFIEIQKDSEGYVWFMLHSGSRNLGKKVCDYYNNVAKELNDLWESKVPKEYELAFLPKGTDEYNSYIKEMNYCLEFAYQNRKLMCERIIDSFKSVIDCSFESIINIHHNYAVMENHYGTNVMVHRKGATSARLGEIGIIPGSQGTKSYIVKGKGNIKSFMSCSHGAGRKMGRKEAERTLNLESEINKLNDIGVIHAIRSSRDLDEAPGAYKDIDIVMKEQSDLVEVVTELTPIAVIKG